MPVTEGLTLACDHPGIVMLKMEDGKVAQISVSDPNRELTRFHLSLSHKVEGSGENYQAIWDANKGVSRMWIDLPLDNYSGDSVTVKIN